jgi:hypothetical protein
MAARSPRLRKFAPALPLLVAAYGMWKKHKASQETQQLATAAAH